MVSQDCQVHNSACSLFLVIITRPGRLAMIRWSFCMSQSQRSFASRFPWQMFGCAYTICLNGQISISCTITGESPCPPSRVLQHLLIFWLIVLSLSPHNLFLLFCCVLSMQTMIWLVLMDMFSAAIGVFCAIIIIIIYSLEFFISELANSLSLEFEWLQVFSSFQDSSQYSGRSH